MYPATTDQAPAISVPRDPPWEVCAYLRIYALMGVLVASLAGASFGGLPLLYSPECVEVVGFSDVLRIAPASRSYWSAIARTPMALS